MKSLFVLVLLAPLALVSCGTSNDIAVKATEPSTHSPVRGLAAEIRREVNVYRQTQGLNALKGHSGLDKLAQQHANYMRDNAGKFGLEGKLISHFGFEGRALVARKKYQINELSENVIASSKMGQGEDLAGKFLSGWLRSSNHRHQIHSKWSTTGVGVAYDAHGRVFAVQLFGSPVSQINTIGAPTTW
ncbi:MAG: CAP domain-containing protein [Verrucomicrobiota bacterium]